MSNSEALPQPLIETLAGFVAGIASTLVAHPLDLIKTRLQGTLIHKVTNHELLQAEKLTIIVDRKSSSPLGSSLRITRDIARNEGLLTGFYRGLTPNIIGNSVSWALYFLWYGRLKDGLQYLHGEHHPLLSYDYFLGSATAGKKQRSIGIGGSALM